MVVKKISRFWETYVFAAFLNTGKWLSKSRLCVYVCMQTRMCTSLAPERFYGFYSTSVCNSLSDTGRSPVNVHILAPKLGALHMRPLPTKWQFFENSSNGFDEISAICGDLILKCTCIGGIFRNIKVRALGAQIQNVGFIRTGFTGRTDVTVVP
jgi:hypothetical protein